MSDDTIENHEISQRGMPGRVQVSLPSWTMLAVAWIVCIAAVMAAVFAGKKLNERYGWFNFSTSSEPRIAVVDVEAVLEPYKRDFVAAMSAPKVADADRDRANDTVRRASVAVGVAVKAIAAECQCALFVRAAVFNPEVLDDHTEQLAQRTAELLKQAQGMTSMSSSMTGVAKPSDTVVEGKP